MWLCTIIGVILGVILAPLTLKVWNFAGYSLYDRSGLDDSLLKNLGTYSWDNIIVDDLIITAYEYNSKQPRFYSKYFNRLDPGFYDLLIHQAVAASSSAPFGFNPYPFMNKYGLEEFLVDGGIICNSPALYAYEIASDLKDKTDIRVLSIGTGIGKPTSAEPTDPGKFQDDLQKLSLYWDFAYLIETAAANVILE